MSSCLGCWFWLSCCLGAALLPFLAVVVVSTLRGVPRFQNSHGRRPSIYREGEPTEGWGRLRERAKSYAKALANDILR